MSNWTIHLKSQVDLEETMLKLSSFGYLSYFLRGYPLIVKLPTDFRKSLVIVEKNTADVYEKKEVQIENANKEVSLLIFRSGSCIVSGPSEEACASNLHSILDHIVYK